MPFDTSSVLQASAARSRAPARRWETQTIALLFGCYGLLALALFAPLPVWVAIPVLAVAVTLHSSLQHEVIHGHPTPWQPLNAALVWPALGVCVPYGRFRDTHLEHHKDATLTDPYDDPESNYMDPKVWHRLPAPARVLLRANNTLLGRITLGPAVSMAVFYAQEWRLVITDGRVRRVCLLHLPAVALVLGLVWLAPLSMGVYLIGVYIGHGILRIRTFLEHRAHAHAAARTVIIEDRGPMALLFLNNNLHVVHHMHPHVAWYDLPALYRANKDRYLARNKGYRYASYGSVFRAYLLTAKDPVPHPHYPD